MIEQNSPIYVKTFNQSAQLDDIKFHFIVHTSLDSFEEKRTSHLPVLLIICPAVLKPNHKISGARHGSREFSCPRL